MFVSGYSADMIALFPLIARAFRYNSVARSLAFGVQRQGMLLKGLVKDDFRYNLLSRYCKTVRPHRRKIITGSQEYEDGVPESMDRLIEKAMERMQVNPKIPFMDW